MNSVVNGEFQVQWYDDQTSTNLVAYSYAKDMLLRIARATGNMVCIVPINEALSVAHSKKISLKRNYFVNLDDDLIISPRSLERLLESTQKGIADVITIGVMDADNSRGFKDFDEVRYTSMEHFLQHHPPGKAKHHYFANEFTFHNQKWISQLYCMTQEVYQDMIIWRPVLDKFTQRGIRGYDIVLENQLAASKYSIALHSGNEAIHIGLEEPYIGGQWTGTDSIATTVVSTKDGFNVSQ
jgi:hypothetical protein